MMQAQFGQLLQTRSPADEAAILASKGAASVVQNVVVLMPISLAKSGR